MFTLPPDTLLHYGVYKIIRFISHGGFGCTYEAEHLMLNKRVAIKEFFVQDFCNRDEVTAHVTVATQSKRALVEKLRKKFIDEARSVAALSHPAIVKVTDVFEENGTAYYVMDYIAGESVSQMLLRRGSLPEEVALRYIRQVCSALAYVHGRNILHLDIKPGNIMIDSDSDQAMLIDFGAAKQYDEVSGENTSSLMGKTPGYAPAEQMGNNVSHFTPATDIYALGATLYKMLSGVTPPSSHLLAAVEELSPLPSTVSSNVCHAVDAAMRIRKKDRPQSVAEFLEIIDVKDTNDSDEVDSKHIKIVDDEATLIDHPEDQTQYSASSQSLHNSPQSQSVHFSKTSQSASPTSDPSTSLCGNYCGHEWVDLGLSVKWATCNVGASSLSDYGDYYAWGEINPKSQYTEENSKLYNVDESELKSKGMIDGAGNLMPLHDAVRQNWGAPWRMPTITEVKELINNCNWTWTTQDGHNGFKVTGPNGTSIFLPAAGFRLNSVEYVGSYGNVWTSSIISGAKSAYYLNFHSSYHYSDYYGRYYGFSLRAVME